MKKHSQLGAGHIGLVLLLVVAAIIAFVGYEVVKTNNAVTPPSTATNTLPSGTTVPAITNTAGLNAAENTLNSTNLDQGLDPSGYGSDVNSLL